MYCKVNEYSSTQDEDKEHTPLMALTMSPFEEIFQTGQNNQYAVYWVIFAMTFFMITVGLHEIYNAQKLYSLLFLIFL